MHVKKCYRSSLFFQVPLVAWIFFNITAVLLMVYLIFPFITCTVTNSLSSGKKTSWPWGRQYSKLVISKNQYYVLLHMINTTTALIELLLQSYGRGLFEDKCDKSVILCAQWTWVSCSLCPCCTLHICRSAHQVCEASKCGCNIATTGGMFSVSVFKTSEGCYETCI